MVTCKCTTFSSLLLLLFLLSAANLVPATSSDGAYSYLLSSKPVSHTTGEKQSHFRFYWHDIFTGPNPTSVRVAEAPGTKNSSTFFGAVVMIDDALTIGPDLNTKLVGRAQGLYAGAGLKKIEFLMAMNFVLTDGIYNGSTIAIIGHNEVLNEVREMSIVGGTGLFRLSRGYVQARTFANNDPVEYNVFINHY
ncbi:Disease resistance-responsive family protein [Carex littledalei]|uniref:Dirigent protein n=1 Tax=Carex littledalei TaxID=544730 RepID=A0A833REL5_9POAL|nr:Disease resistance-responsive family protein [Carex littledalei]